jgi:peptidoglycan/LPS O-acetylase OafA/YrhL
MIRFEPAGGYRHDIDGLRAIAVLAVICFHFGFLPNGFLGVDIFFVISGFLITGIICNELAEARFSMVGFYLRRTRRIIPLAVFISAVTLFIGALTMLPDDMENMAQSVIASNFFANNILQAITTKDYWDVVNEYKPLMHTWSLGLEEQYYLLYPPLLWMLGSRRSKWLLPILVALALASVLLLFLPFEDYIKFWLCRRIRG